MELWDAYDENRKSLGYTVKRQNWVWTGDSKLMGENSIDGAVREVKEELGLTVDNEKLTLFTSYKRELYKDFVDVYIY